VRIVIAGGSGFLGRALQKRLERDGHTVGILTRRPTPGLAEHIAWTADGSAGSWARALEGIDAVVNLAGEGIADRRWNAERKAALRSSRVLATRSLVAAFRQVAQPPAVFINGSAIGYYGDRGDEIVTEATPPGTDFLATLCVDWEREAEQASSITRVVSMRTAPVLDFGGGVLRKMLLPFRLGVGGPLGPGTQYMPWIHMSDWAALVAWQISNPQARGAFNGTAPAPVTNAEFSRTLGRVLHRPAVMRVPAVALRLLVGELADSLLTGQRAVPARANAMGLAFEFNDLGSALRDLISRKHGSAEAQKRGNSKDGA